MTVYITKEFHGSRYEYLTIWFVDGVGYHDWFPTQKEMHEYFDRYYPKYVRTNF